MTTQTLRLGRRARRSANPTLLIGPRLVPLAFYTLLVIGLFFAMIYLRIALDRTAFELDSIDRAITTEESRQLDLRLTIAQLQDPVRIATEAERIGMTTPNERIPIAISAARGIAPPSEPESPVSALSGGRP